MIGVGLSVGLASAPQSGGPAAPNPNLLLWSETFDNATWAKSNATVTANAGLDPLGGSTADEVANGTSTATIGEVSTVAAASGGATVTVVPLAEWTRFSVTATFDTGQFTFSLWLRDPADNGSDLQVRMEVSGGFIRCFLRDGGESLTFLAWGAKLEIGGSATGTAANYGRTEG